MDAKKLPDQLIVSRVKKNHCVTVPTYAKFNEASGQNTAVVWLDGPECTNADWFLCMDMVRLPVIRRYIYSRMSRVGSIGWLRVFKRAEAILVAEQAAQAELRTLLANAALENGILAPNEVDEAIEVALVTWRAAHKGADAPFAHDTKAVHELLTLMFPVDRLAKSTQEMVDELIIAKQFTPLKLCRTGKNRFVLYVLASQEDRAPYSTGVQWGWVKRALIDVQKKKLSVASTSFVWLEKDKPDATEAMMREWPEYANWVHNTGEPCELKSLAHMKAAMLKVEAQLADVLARGRAQPCKTGIDDQLFDQLLVEAKAKYQKMKYLSDISLAIPVGVFQFEPEKTEKGNPALFLYAKTPAYAFVDRYGSPEQLQTYKNEVLLKRFYSRSVERMVKDANAYKWSLIQTKAPFKTCVLEANASYEVPRNVHIDGHKSGGVKKKARRSEFGRDSTRAERRAKNGNPWHEREQHILSWSRRIESILGLAPHLKHAFYKDQRKWAWSKSKTEKQAVFEPNSPAHFDFSKMIWDAAQNRSHANKYFSTSN